ncbi:MAG: hypothetical protein PWP24_1504, partial [Clostridiales bacterium]|nr:hypothetical protein [Clostridiales bacterium]
LYREERTLPGEETLRVLDVAAKMLGETSVKLSFQRKMEKMAYYDQLTGVPNRQFLGEYMKSALENASKSKEPLAVFFIDIDSFKLINDTLGHHSGDQILKVIAQRVKQELHSNDFICRFGGDEFLILISSQDSYEDYLTFARKLVNSISLPIFSEGQKYTITASLGVSIYPDDGIDYETLIKNADNAMYKAKEKGKNQYVICTEEIKAEVRRKQIITSDLYRALEKRELFLMYQPQISLLDGMQRGMEVLARWKHPIYGMISPDVFIPIAEQTGVIESIGLWIIGEACRQEKEWEVQGLSALRIAVNVSVKQLLYPDFIKHIQELLDKMQMEASHLEFEIAENIAIHETEAIVPILNQIKKMGISIAIDDFGMEYSSLSRIQSLPVNRLKIDMNFIQGITKGEKDQIIIDVIIKLAKRLKIEVIAEGVEKEEEVQFLAEKGCQ